MNGKGNLPKGFITIDDALALMEADTRTNPVVDTSFMMRHYTYSRTGGNFTIPLLARDAQGKIYRKGETFIHFEGEEDLWKFRGALKRHYKALAGKEIDENPVRHISTAVDPEKNPQGRPIPNDKPITKAGQDLGSGEVTMKE